MGDVSSVNIDFVLFPDTRPSDKNCLLGQSESNLNFGKQTWLPHATAFDDMATTPQNVEDEMPTRPATPGIEDKSTDSAPSADARICLIQDEEKQISSASRTRCAVCSTDFITEDSHERVEHFNACWSNFSRTVSAKKSERKSLEAKHPGIRSDPHISASGGSEGKRRLAHGCVICNSSLERLDSIDVFEHRCLCLQNLLQLPKSCVRCNISFITDGSVWKGADISEHLYICFGYQKIDNFEDAQNSWYERLMARKDPRNCACCSRRMENLEAVEAFHHQRICLKRRRATYCPLCFAHMPPIVVNGTWTLEDALWHVRNCQHDKSLTVIDKDDFDTLDFRYKGRMTAVWRFFARENGTRTGKRKGWTSTDHRHSYQNKQAKGRANRESLYLSPPSKLRIVATHAQDAIRVVRSIRSSSDVWDNFERFRRSSHCVYSLPTQEELSSWMKREYELCGIDYAWYEDRKEIFDVASETDTETEDESAIYSEDEGQGRACNRKHEQGVRPRDQGASHMEIEDSVEKTHRGQG